MKFNLKSRKYFKPGILLYFLFFLQMGIAEAQLKLAPNTYLIIFTDKNKNSFQLSNPEKFLSSRALQRRQRQNITIKLNDLPVSVIYVDSLRKMGFTILNTSKWHNAVSVEATDPSLFDKLANVSFILPSKKYKSLSAGNAYKKKPDEIVYPLKTQPADFYGLSYDQIAIHHGDFLHSKGYRGQGMLIAVIDAGFNNANHMSGLDSLWIENRVKLMRDTYDSNGNVFNEDSHGAEVLSTMAATKPGNMVGTAPKASYLLLRSEVASSEYLIEEFNWSVAAELADSIGADIITTSLGYTQFDDSMMSHTYQDMNGHTTLVSKAASIASSKGMIVVVSAGNDGIGPWRYISAPADADSILTVGAIGTDGIRAAFSSVGPTFDRRIKPDIMAVGYYATIQTPSGSFVQGNGTSFSAPIISGLTACLWQANPGKSNIEIMNAIRQNSSQYNSPDSLMGYGIPDFKQAYFNLSPLVRLGGKSIISWPNPFTTSINIEFGPMPEKQVTLSIFDMTGRRIFEKLVSANENDANIIVLSELSSFAKGIYVVRVMAGSRTMECKVVKM